MESMIMPTNQYHLFELLDCGYIYITYTNSIIISL